MRPSDPIVTPSAPALAGISPETLQKSRDYCRDLTRRAARNFYYGLKLLPEPKRSAMYALYAYMRLVDDIADGDAAPAPSAAKVDLDHWQTLTHQTIAAVTQPDPANPTPPTPPIPRSHILWPAFADMVRNYHVPASVFDDMIAGQRQDLAIISFPSFPALREYCYRVASVVGVASLYVFGFEGGDETLALGADRGIAFQLTNILRDLHEDAAPPRNRCYIPQDELQRFGVTHAQIAAGKNSREFRDLMEFQITRARDFYKKSAPLEQRVHPDARPTLIAMTAIYRGLLEKIAKHPHRVLKHRTRLSPLAKLLIAYRAMKSK